jgi:hypothetical protein
MQITEQLIQSFLLCPYKMHLLLKGAVGQKSDYEILQDDLCSAYLSEVLRTDYGQSSIAKHRGSNCSLTLTSDRDTRCWRMRLNIQLKNRNGPHILTLLKRNASMGRERLGESSSLRSQPDKVSRPSEPSFALMSMTIKVCRESIITCLYSEPLDAVLAEVLQWPPRRAISPLIACLFHGDEKVRWHAVSALGAITATLAETSPEAARTVVRRLMWSLNGDSGGIGWGAPEALAEIMAIHGGFAEEFGHMLVAYMRPDGCYLELPALQRGLMWGLGRLVETRPYVLRDWGVSVYLPPYLDSGDPEVRGLCARALGLLKVNEAKERLDALKEDPAEFHLYNQGVLKPVTVGSLAGAALKQILNDP